MYDLRQFKPALYLLAYLSIIGFAIAAEDFILFFLGAGALLVNNILIVKKKFHPLPRWVAATVSVVGFGYVTEQIWHNVNTPILLIGQFIVFAMIVKFYEQRGNRDYVQILVLCFLLLTSAAISTARLAFAMVFFPSMVLLLYCSLIYHLKVQTDKAREAQTLPAEKIGMTTLRQDQRYLGKSMRRLTVLVSLISLSSAIFVFLFWPRGIGAGLFGNPRLTPAQTLTGFSDEMQMNQIASITSNETPVATVEVHHRGQLVTSGSIRLRGLTFDRYGKGRNGEWRWYRPAMYARRGGTIDVTPTSPLVTSNAAAPAEWTQKIQLQPIGAKTLFAMAGMKTFRPSRDVRIAYFPGDETVQLTDDNRQRQNILQYEVTSTNALSTFVPVGRIRDDQSGSEFSRSEISSDILKFAFNPEVSGLTVAQANDRAKWSGFSNDDEKIAQNIEKYFHKHFSYSLDLTDDADAYAEKDPLSVFVSQPEDKRRGHCEYFAGAMTLACQSLGLQARLVTGFSSDEFNSYSSVFQIRQSHAHAWVEVLTPDHGWVTFEPTSGRVLPPNEARSKMQTLRHVFDWLEMKWGTAVVAYDGGTKDNIISRIDNKIYNSAASGSASLSRFSRQWNRFKGGAEFWSLSLKVIASLIGAMAVAGCCFIIWFVIERYRIRMRAKRMGLNALPMSEQMRLARQLGFYEQLMEVLAQHKITRKPSQTPQEFARSLTFLPLESYRAIERLTRLFYRIRFGGAYVQLAQQKRLERAVGEVADKFTNHSL